MKNRDEVYVIGEIGQNHNGSVKIAKDIIDVVTKPIVEKNFGIELKGMNAVKLTKRDLKQELTNSAMDRPYNSVNSFGKTYGEHRAFLELSDEEHFEIYKYAKGKGLDFVETLCAPGCVSLLNFFQPDYLKVASRDLTNIPLLEVMAETKIPMIVSTGMAGEKELNAAIDVITRYHSDLSILHCVSEYPTRPENANLRTITYLQQQYQDFTIGYSDHTIGIAAPVAAVSMGARVIEKHITLDRTMKGTDQIGSLGPDGIYRMMRDIRLIEQSLGEEAIFISDSVIGAKEKLARSLAAKKTLDVGHVITEEDLTMLSPGDGFSWLEREKVIGKKVSRKIDSNELIYPNHLSE